MQHLDEELAECYHKAARELGSTIPTGHYHLYNVQRLLHCCYWYQTEARFPEAWHVLSSAVREMQELSFHKESNRDTLSEFDREMRRRLWCIADTWDWQLSSSLCRPTIIDRSDCRVELPTLALENPSPFMHMRLQSELINELFLRFEAPKNIASPVDVKDYQNMVESWMERFPAFYRLKNPDQTIDLKHPWIVRQRYYIWTMAYLMMVNAIRPYMVHQYDYCSRQIELEIRANGVQHCLQLLRILQDWTRYSFYGAGRLHFIILPLLETTAILSTALIKDTDYTIPSRPKCVAAIGRAVETLKRLCALSSTPKVSRKSGSVDKESIAKYELLVRPPAAATEAS